MGNLQDDALLKETVFKIYLTTQPLNVVAVYDDGLCVQSDLRCSLYIRIEKSQTDLLLKCTPMIDKASRLSIREVILSVRVFLSR